MAAESDYFVVAAPLTPQTRQMISADVLASLKQGAVLINVGRGPLVDETALCDALEVRGSRNMCICSCDGSLTHVPYLALLRQHQNEDHPLAGVALDVFEHEPLPDTSRLWHNPNALLSPHCADMTPTFMEDSVHMFVENVKLFLAGEPLRNLVDKDAGY
eukprot:scaffold1239_cov175-Pinguiococcus_pyrenoidosus.AAC.53